MNCLPCSEAKPISASSNSRAKIFTFEELASATRNFQDDCFLGQGRCGKVYKGHLDGQVVAIRQVDQTGNRNFLVEVLMLDLLRHPNIVNLIGYCADGDHRLLAYNYMPLGSLKDYLYVVISAYTRESIEVTVKFVSNVTYICHGFKPWNSHWCCDLSPGKKHLDWDTRVKIALETGKALENLHDKAEPPVIHRNVNCASILLDDGYQAKLSDFGLAKLSPIGGKNYVSTKFKGTIGYSAPEYAMTGRLSVKSDIYSFGVVLLEIFTGRKATENSADDEEHSLVEWARVLIKDGKFSEMVDPSLQGHYPASGLQQALRVAEMCVEAQPDKRPAIAEVVATLTHIASETQAVQNST